MYIFLVLLEMALSAHQVNNKVWKIPKAAFINGHVHFIHCCLTMALVSILQVMMAGYI